MSDLLFVVTFRGRDDDAPTTLRVRHVGDSDLGPGFICLSDFVFTRSTLALPHEEALAKKYEHTRRLHLNVFSIQSIAEEGAEHPGLSLDTDRTHLVMVPDLPDPEGG
jgi:hypothetical protein